MSTIPMTARDAKNKILAEMDETERQDAIVGETRDGSFIILTENRVIEVHQTGSYVYAQGTVHYSEWQDIKP